MTLPQNIELNTFAALATDRTPRSFSAGEVIFSDAEPGDSLFGVVSGEIELCRDGTCVELIGPGSCFGIAALVDADHSRSGTAKAHTDAEVLELDREQFLFALQELPMFGLELLHDMEMRLQRLREQLPTG